MTERNINLTIGALTLGLVFSIGALAEGLSKGIIEADKAGYAAAGEQCGGRAGNAKDVCVKEAKAAEAAAKAAMRP